MCDTEIMVYHFKEKRTSNGEYNYNLRGTISELHKSLVPQVIS